MIVLFKKTLWDYRFSLVWWAVGLLAMTYMYLSFYPTISDSPGIAEFFNELPKSIQSLFGGVGIDYTSGPGYLDREVFSFLLPLLLFIFAIGAASRMIAGEEEGGTMDLLLSAPISRRRLLAEKAAAVVVMTLMLGFVEWVGLAIGINLFDMNVVAANLLAATLGAVAWALLFAAVALLVGSATERRSTTFGVCSALAVVSLLISSLAPLAPWLEPWRKFSPYYHYLGYNPLHNGFSGGGHIVILLVTAALFALLAFPVFQRKDVAG